MAALRLRRVRELLRKSGEVGGVVVRTPLSQPIRGSGAPPAEHEFDAFYKCHEASGSNDLAVGQAIGQFLKSNGSFIIITNTAFSFFSVHVKLFYRMV